MTPLAFDNRFLAELPGEPDPQAGTRQVHGALWSPVQPTPVSRPRLLAVTTAVAAAIGFAPDDLEDPAFTEVFAGNRLLPGMQPFASNYGGHQFGHWAGQLGDGRVIGLGEVVGADSARHELQLKAPAPRPIRASPMAARCCGLRCASSCAARPCTTSASRPPAR